MSSYKVKFKEEIFPALKNELSLKNNMQVPKFEKVVINMGVGEAIGDKKALEYAVSDMELISGQKPQVTKARKSIAGFKVRESWPIGCKVTLRKNKMYHFLERFISIALPRVRDFRGISPKQFDGHGNFSMGIDEQIIFPEIDFDKVNKIRGMNVTIVTSVDDDHMAMALLKSFNFPFRR